MQVTILSVEHFPYRTAMGQGQVAQFPREMMREWEAYLAGYCCVREDNHTGYLVQYIDYSTFFMFSDSVCYVYTDYRKRNW
jgi:hypothetical protein